jgi:hypothetical protein
MGSSARVPQMAASRPFTWSNIRDFEDLVAFRQYLLDNAHHAEDIRRTELLTCIFSLAGVVGGEVVRIGKREDDDYERSKAQIDGALCKDKSHWVFLLQKRNMMITKWLVE